MIQVLCPFGVNLINDAGRAFTTFLIRKVFAQRQLSFRNQIMLHGVTLAVRKDIN